MLLGGEAAPAFVEMLTPFGMRMDVVSTDQIGLRGRGEDAVPQHRLQVAWRL